MRVIDLTIPLYEGMSYGNIYPFETPFKIETFGNSRMKREIFTMNAEPGTRRLMGPDGKMEDGIVVLQDTAIVDVGRKGPEEKVTPEEIENGMAAADFREGDAFILRTGWGDNESYRKMGDDWEWMCPCIGRDDTFQKIAEVMAAKKSKLFCYDTPNAYDMPDRWKTWTDKKPKPKLWPSAESKAWIDAWTKDASVGPDLSPDKLFGRLTAIGVTLIGALVNTGEIKKKRVKLIALPLKVEGSPMGPCNVVAIEE